MGLSCSLRQAIVVRYFSSLSEVRKSPPFHSSFSSHMDVSDVLTNHVKQIGETSFRLLEDWNQQGSLDDVINVAELMQQKGLPISRDDAYRLAQECERQKNLACGRRLYSLMVYGKVHSVSILADHLIRLFASYGCLDEAAQIFSKVLKPSKYTWTSIIAAHTNLGDADKAIKLYDRMLLTGVESNKYAYLAVLKACIVKMDFEKGKLIHEQINKSEIESDIFIANTLMDMYAKCGDLIEAHKIFDKLLILDVVSWSTIIGGHAQHGKYLLALQCFDSMQNEGIKPNRVTFLGILKACASTEAIEQGRYIHELVIEIGLLQFEITVANTVIDMYAKCGCLEESYSVFERLPNRDTVSWGAMIAGYAQCGEGFLALECFNSMRQTGIEPDKVTCLGILKACSSIGITELGKQIHEQIIQSGLGSDRAVGNTLVDMYAKCGALNEAYDVFEKLNHRDSVSWGAMICGYAYHNEGILALQSYECMQHWGVKPTKIVFFGILRSCATLGIVHGRCIHEQIINYGLQSDVTVANMLIDMYAKCGNLQEAHKIFHNLPSKDDVSWGAIILGYAQHDEGHLALHCFENMQHGGIRPRKVMFVAALKACVTARDVPRGRYLHEHIIQSGLQSDVIVANILIDMYAKLGNMEEAHEIFERLPFRTVVSWSTMIAAYSQNAEGFLALECFHQMLDMDIKPDKVTFLNILKACTSIGAIEQGRQVHNMIVQMGLQFDMVVGSTLVDMYAKCGIAEDACEVFRELQMQDVVSWGAMIAGYAQLGDAFLAAQCFEKMKHGGVEPDDKTFTGILNACSHAGLVEEGYLYFKFMKEHYCILPDMFHYSCMVDLLGHAGCFKEAEELLQATIPFSMCGLMTLLSACKTYGNVQLGRRCFDKIICLDSYCGAAYVLMSNIYSDAHMMIEANEIEKLRKRIGARRRSGGTCIEVGNRVHRFTIGDERHHEVETMLKNLSILLQEKGYVPEISLLPAEMSEKDKEDAFCGHSEKLAIAYGLLNTPPGTTIRVTKDLRVCNDCHETTKIISKIADRQIMLRCSNRIHCFRNGTCSCGGYY